MLLSEQAQATLLLTVWLGKRDASGATPLTPSEWGRFARFLRDTGRSPADLLHERDTASVLAGYQDGKVTLERIDRLLGRAAALGIALEKWQRTGLWVLTRSDAHYPQRWKHLLKHDAPPVLFGAGNRDLLNQGGIAVVGARDLDEAQMAFTAELGRTIAHQGQALISGGARGADEAAMLGALAAEGAAIGVLADSLLRASTSAKYRQALMRHDLALISPFNPEVGFNTGNAMARNKYIYCLSNAAIVIAATENKGGTWAGATENLKRGWVPLWIRHGSVPGNQALVDRGANWLPEEMNVQQLSTTPARAEPVVPCIAEELEAYTLHDLEPGPAQIPQAHQAHPDSVPDIAATMTAPSRDDSSYEDFLSHLGELLHEQALSLQELKSQMGVKHKQLCAWLREAIKDGVLLKTHSPAKYKWRAKTEAKHVEAKIVRKEKMQPQACEDESSQTEFGF